jgi:hypothetical protein
MKEKAKSEMQKLVERVRKNVGQELKSLNVVRKEREEIQGKIAEMEKKAAISHEKLRESEAQLETAILNNQPTTTHLRNIELLRASSAAFEKERTRLEAADSEAGGREKTALKGLSEALWREIVAIKPEVEAQVRALLEEIRWRLLFFESLAFETAREFCGPDPWGWESPRERELGRFVDVFRVYEDLEGFLSPCGEYFSHQLRRKLAQEFLG